MTVLDIDRGRGPTGADEFATGASLRPIPLVRADSLLPLRSVGAADVRGLGPSGGTKVGAWLAPTVVGRRFCV